MADPKDNTPENSAKHIVGAKDLIVECAISAHAISHLADLLYDECLGTGTGNEAAMMAVLIRDSSDRIEKRLDRAIEQMEERD